MEDDSLEQFNRDTLDIAFYLQDNIYRYGLPPVRFMDSAHDEMKRNATLVFRKNIRKYK
jgi:hypothetical protein